MLGVPQVKKVHLFGVIRVNHLHLLVELDPCKRFQCLLAGVVHAGFLRAVTMHTQILAAGIIHAGSLHAAVIVRPWFLHADVCWVPACSHNAYLIPACRCDTSLDCFA